MSEIILYSTPSGAAKVEITYEEENFWLSQRQIAELFGVTVPTINEHLRTVFDTGELDERAVIRNFRITAAATRSDIDLAVA